MHVPDEAFRSCMGRESCQRIFLHPMSHLHRQRTDLMICVYVVLGQGQAQFCLWGFVSITTALNALHDLTFCRCINFEKFVLLPPLLSFFLVSKELISPGCICLTLRIEKEMGLIVFPRTAPDSRNTTSVVTLMFWHTSDACFAADAILASALT